MRGERHYQKLTNDHEQTKTTDRKGRNADMIEARDIRLMHRFYYYSRILRYDYNSVLANLSNEFDLAQFTIGKIISAKSAISNELKNNKTTLKQLRDKYPYLNWIERK